MNGGGSMQSNDERGTEKQMDDYLNAIGLHRKKIAKDGSCLFRAVAEQVLHCQSLHTKVRAECVAFLKENRGSYEAFIEGDFEEYLQKLQDPQQWVGEVEINALAVMYKRDFLIFQEPGKPAVNITDNNFKDKVRLCFLNGNHYDSVYSISHIKDAALCQSILYELLYDGVFGVERGALGMCQRIGRPNDFLSDDSMHACVSSDESDADPGESLWEEIGTSTAASRHTSFRGRGGRGRLSDRVRRSLNPTLFRNIEYDVWHKSKRAQQKRDYCIAAGMQFTVGNRCQVRLEGRAYSATIKEVSPDNGPVTVYLEEIGTRKQVPLWSLRPISDESSWSTVVNRDKRLSNGHGEWEERGRGRGRGRLVPASSSSPSVTQATAPGPTGGRVLKQQSWPPQSAVEEQGGAKASRSSVSSIESAFGVTEEERLAKEEEERNVALVEIQLRDERSFPALGMQSDGGRRKGADKRRIQKNKTKSPVEDVRAASPSAGERPKSSTPPPLASSSSSSAASSSSSAPSTNTPPLTKPALPAAKPPAAPSAKPDANAPSWLSSIKASTTPTASAAAASVAASSSTSSLPVPRAAAPKPSAPSDAVTQLSLPAAPSAKAPVTGGSAAVPSSATVFSFLTPALPSASSPPTPHAPPSSSTLSSPPLESSASPPPSSSSSSSSAPPPTFIAPIAPSPSAATAHGFLPPSSSSLPHSPSPPSFSSSSLTHHAAQVHAAAPPASVQISLPNLGATLTASQTFQSQASLSQIHPHVSLPQNQSPVSVTQTHIQPSVPQNAQTLTPQMQNEVHSCLQQHQHQPQSHSEVASLPQTQQSVVPPSLPQASVSHLQSPFPSQSQYPSQSHSQYPSQAQYPSQSQSEMAQAQSSHPAPAGSYPLPSQTSVPVPASLQPPVTHPNLHTQTPPHPSQVPHPSLSLSTSHPSLHPHSSSHITQNQTETPQPHPPPPPHPQLQSGPPPHYHPSIPGAVPLQQLSQLYQDPLYPGFPQGEKGEVAPTPALSSSKSGEDLPPDLNILKFFFNLGVKAYSMPIFPPYMYLLPLQQAHTLHPKLPSRSPSPPPQYPPSRHQDEYPQYPPTSASMPPHYDHQAQPAEPPPHPSDPSFNQAGYPPPPHRMSWQQHQMAPPRNPNYSVGYHSQNPSYLASPPLPQGYHPGQAQGHLYPQYPPSSMGFQSSPNREEHQASQQGAPEHRRPANGDALHGQGPGRGPGPLESPAAANVANANNSRTGMVVPGFALKNEQGDSSTKMVLLVDPPLNNTPIMKLVSNSDVSDVPMATMKPGSAPASPTPYDLISKTTVAVVHGDNSNPCRSYRGHRKPLVHANAYVPLGAPEGYLATVADSLSVGCSTEDNWEEAPGLRPPTFNPRGTRKVYRGGRGRGGHDSLRGAHRRRQGGEAGAGLNYVQFNASHRGRGRERGY
ncbi:hypothetical protein EPR50_G00194020 [Perca flavescens]|uniref:ubiquitinyl hydrolase 1 n=1 Tax=Perca flavescens TaxID=8167 RepID=A0A484C6P6_PERFV|nr:OTU domain-containing protein 4 [Perca flavescens]TDG99406.1 hypothetical protein EPR50_G00194020 [Perca flavescens]